MTEIIVDGLRHTIPTAVAYRIYELEACEKILDWVRSQLAQGRTIRATDPDKPIMVINGVSCEGNLTICGGPPWRWREGEQMTTSTAPRAEVSNG